MLRFIGRLILIPLGLALAAATAGVFLVAVGFVQPQIGGALTEAAIATVRMLVQGVLADGESLERLMRLAQGVTSLSLAVLFLPVAIVAAVAEVFSLRLWFLQMLMGALLTALLPWAMTPELITGQPLASPLTALLGATGALAASIYWMVAGRAAGREPETVEERATMRAPAARR
jgi:hypothetical protein